MIIRPSIDNDFGVYRGIVAVNKDPVGLGRVKVRIVCYHGDNDTGIPDNDLPWAPIVMPGASSNAGMFIVPEVNSTVVVMFENGNHHQPIVIGGVYSKGRKNTVVMEESENSYKNEGSPFKAGSNRSGRTVVAGTHDVPAPARKDTAVKVIYRSPKGAQITVTDKDGEETLSIEDANGQTLVFESPMSSEKTKDNIHQHNPPKQNIVEKAKMLLSNSLGQILKFKSDGKSAKMDLVDTLTKMGIEIDGDGKRCRLFNHDGQKVEICLSKGIISMQSSGAFVEVSNNAVNIKASQITVEAPTVNINGTDVALNGTVTAGGALIAGGTNLAGHTHSIPSGVSGIPVPGVSAPVVFSPPVKQIDEWKEE